MNGLAVSREFEAGTDLSWSEITEIRKNLGLGHPGSEVVGKVVHCDAKAANAGSAPSFADFDGDDVPDLTSV